jgi:hypothetical protein
VPRMEDASVEFEYILDEDIVCSIGKAYSRCLSTPAWSNEPSGQKDFDGDKHFVTRTSNRLLIKLSNCWKLSIGQLATA